MNVIKDRRETEQIPKYDEYGRITHYEIPNYIKRNLLEESERKFYFTLINIVKKLKLEEKYRYLQISTQVAINRIVKINDKRKQQFLTEEIRDKSIDYVLFDLSNGNVECCIELNGEEHYNNSEIQKKDKLKAAILKDVKINLISVPVQIEYNEEEIIRDIKRGFQE